MDYIVRTLHQRIKDLFKPSKPEGLILAGVVGCGKTTLVNKVLEELSTDYQTFSYTGDDLHFRDAVTRDTRYLFNDVRAKTQKKALIFIDEVQKCANVFDAVKYAFDRDISFIISGSNPYFLTTEARKRLQRRGQFFTLTPFSLPELLAHRGILESAFSELLLNIITDKRVGVPKNIEFTFTKEIAETVNEYLRYGGLPLSYLAKKSIKKLENIARVVERGFEAIMFDTNDVRDLVSIELAHIHSREFTYKTLYKQTGITKRDTINEIINGFMGHGYLLKKKPLLFEKDRRTYLNVFSYIDPGIVTYLTGETDIEQAKGQRVEGIVHSGLDRLLQNIPLKIQLNYFKPYTIDINGKTKFQDGEIDFVISQGTTRIPIEVKSSSNITDNDTVMVRKFIQDRKCPFGIIIYGGVPQWRKDEKLLYWPYWLV